jgi:hypothetical protein
MPNPLYDLLERARIALQNLAIGLKLRSDASEAPTPPITPPDSREALLAAMIEVESHGDDYAIGDRDLKP